MFFTKSRAFLGTNIFFYFSVSHREICKCVSISSGCFFIPFALFYYSFSSSAHNKIAPHFFNIKNNSITNTDNLHTQKRGRVLLHRQTMFFFYTHRWGGGGGGRFVTGVFMPGDEQCEPSGCDRTPVTNPPPRPHLCV